MRSQFNQFNLGTLQIYPPHYHTAYCSNVSTFTLSFLRNIQRCIVMQISLLVCNIYIYRERERERDTKDRYIEKSV